MNKIYRLKFDKRRNELVVVSEITAGMGKEKSTGHIADLSALSPFRKLLGTLTPLALLTGFIISLFPGMALAADLPTGGQIVGGQGSISTSGNQMTIHQQTQNMATNWHSFDVGQNNTVQFVQPDSSSVALNRVTGTSGSQIMGTLKANGQVFILNPNGVLFGKGARVNVAGLVASTKNINTADFMKGQYTLSGSGTSGAQVINQGSLTTSKGGYIVLAGERVSNSGTVTTPGGKTVLAAGKTVTLQLDNGGLTSVSVNGSVVNALVENRGLISATNGQVYLTAKGKDMLLNTVVNNSGTIEAKGLESRGGEIVLNGGDSGVVRQSGKLLTDSQTGQGGKIILEGQNIHLAGSSLTSATGKTGGGEVYVGGGWQGKDSRIKNASKVVMDKTATVDVSARDAGNGGTAVLWSDDYTNFRGTVLAKGGAQSGNGGRVETSSHNNLQAFGDVNTSASSGKGGEWLLDPTNVTIVGVPAGESNVTSSHDKGTNTETFTPVASGAQILNTSIEDQLNNEANVTIKTSGTDTAGQLGNITIAKDVSITKSAGGEATLTLRADNNIQVGGSSVSVDQNVSISSSLGALNLNLLAGNTVNDGSAQVYLGKKPNISLHGGDFVVGSAQGDEGKIKFVVERGVGRTIQAKDIKITALGAGGMNTNGLGLNATGDIDINTSSVKSLSDWGNNVTWNAGGHLTVNSTGNIDLLSNTKDKNDIFGGKTTLSAVNDVVIKSNNGTVNMDGTGNVHSIIDISSSQGSVSLFGVAPGAPDHGLTGVSVQNVQISAATTASLTGKADDSGNEGLAINKLTIKSDKVDIIGTSGWGEAAQINRLNVTSAGDVNIRGQAPGRAWALGLDINNSDINSTGGNVTLTGLSNSDPRNKSAGNGLNIKNSNITVNNTTGRIVLHGSSSDKTGLWVNNSNLSGNSLSVLGMSTNTGKGFVFDNSHLLADLTNVSLSSAGSAAGVINTLDSNIVNDSNRDTLLEKRIENMTTVDMGGHPIFDDTGKETKGWKKNYSLDGLPNHGWIFNNASVTAGGDVVLNGVGFTNSAVSISNGNLNIDNSGSVPLTGTTITVSDGAVNVRAGAGNIKLNKSDISAKGDITLKANAGSIAVSGTSAEVKASITSTDGNIVITSHNPAGDALYFKNAALNTTKGNITLSGVSDKGTGIKFQGGDYSAGNEIDIYGKGETFIGSSYEGLSSGEVLFTGDSNFSAIKGSVSGSDRLFSDKDDASIQFGSLFFGPKAGSHTSFSGDFTVTSNNGVSFNGPVSVAFSDGDSSINSKVGESSVRNAITGLVETGVGATSNLSANHGNLLVNLSAASGKTVFDYELGATPVGLKLSGDGNIIFDMKADSVAPVFYLNTLDNLDMTGKLTINAINKKGDGVKIDGVSKLSLANADINGTSEGNGYGIIFNSSNQKSKLDLNHNSFTGQSATGAGISINGHDVTITNGNLEGVAKSGSGTGISLSGGDKYILDGVDITGMSVDGASVSVSGALQVNNGTSVRGTASGTGPGIVVNGTLVTTDGDGVTLEGQSDSGDGVQVAGETSLNNATVKGTSASGTGTNIKGPLTVSGTSEIKGTSTSGAGLNIAKKVTVNPPDQETVTFIGTSTEKEGVIISSSIDGGKVAGHSEKGTGIQLNSTGKVSDVILTATSIDGTGLRVEKGSEAEDVEINAQTVAGKAIDGENNALTATSTSISTVGEPGNTNISGNVKPAPGGTPSGVVAEALGNKLSESIAALQKTLDTKLADLDGLQQTMTALQMQFDQAVRTGAVGQADLKRLETLVNGLSDSLHIATVTVAELKGDVGALKTDTGSLEERLKTSDALSSGFQGLTLPAAGDISAVAGELSAAKALQSATVSLQGSLAARAEEEGVVRHLLDSLQQQLKDAQEKGTAGGTVLSGIQTQLESLGQQQRLYMEALARIRQGLATVSGDGSIPVAGRQESVNRLQTALSGVSGVSGIQVSELGRQLQRATTGYAQLVATVQQQGSVNAQTPLQSREQQDGFHAGGEPMVPVHGYQARPQNVDIHLCDGEGCRSVTLDAGKPSQGLMVASTESR